MITLLKCEVQKIEKCHLWLITFIKNKDKFTFKIMCKVQYCNFSYIQFFVYVLRILSQLCAAVCVIKKLQILPSFARQNSNSAYSAPLSLNIYRIKLSLNFRSLAQHNIKIRSFQLLIVQSDPLPMFDLFHFQFGAQNFHFESMLLLAHLLQFHKLLLH